MKRTFLFRILEDWYEEIEHGRILHKSFFFITIFTGEDHPFYLSVATHDVTGKENCQWFLRGPIGRNKLDGLLKTMAVKANLPSLKDGKRLTNSSARKRLCQALLQANVPDTHAVHITGHKNPSSLNNYRVLSNNQ